MANTDLVKKKPVALEVTTYERLSKLAAQLRIDNPGGGFVSMSTAVSRLLDKWEEAEMVASAIDACMQSLPNVSLRSYIADAESNEQVIIKQSDGSQYLEKMLAHNHNAYLTPERDKAMVFDNRDQAAAFLRKCGREVGNWIIEPA